MPNIDHNGSTSLHGTEGDLLVWQRNLVDHRIGGAALGVWMQTSGVLNDGTATGYGLRLGSYRGLRTVSQSATGAAGRRPFRRRARHRDLYARRRWRRGRADDQQPAPAPFHGRAGGNTTVR